MSVENLHGLKGFSALWGGDIRIKHGHLLVVIFLLSVLFGILRICTCILVAPCVLLCHCRSMSNIARVKARWGDLLVSVLRNPLTALRHTGSAPISVSVVLSRQ